MNKENKNRPNDDPLTELLVEVVEVNRGQLVKILKKFIRINAKDGSIIPQDDFNKLTTRNKMLTYMLGRKVALMLNFECSEIVCKDEIKYATGLLRGTITPTLIELKTENLVSRSNLDGYYISDEQAVYALRELANVPVNGNFNPITFLSSKYVE